jgi:HAE1 family hydrophobic/amphiphilic exporter-1
VDAAHARDPYCELSLADVSVTTGVRFLDAVSNAVKRGLVRLDDFYERAIAWSLDHAAAVMGSALLLAVLSALSILLVGVEFVPETDEGRFSVGVETRIGAPFEYTESKVVLVEDMIRQRLGSSLMAMTSSIGRSGGITGFADSASNVAVVDVSMVKKDLREDTVWAVIRDLQERGSKELRDARLSFQVDSISTLANSAQGDATPIVLRVKGKDIDTMLPYARRLLSVLENVPGTRGADISYKEGKPELQFRVRRSEAASLGITPLEVGVTLRTAFHGTEVSRFGKGGEDYPVWVLLRDEDRVDWRSVRSIFFVNRAGAKIPVENVADIQEGLGPFAVFREDRGRVISVTAFLDGTRPLSRVMDELLARAKALGTPPPGVEFQAAGTAKEMASSFRDLFGVLALAVFLVYAVMASQFESLIHPFIILFSIPFAAIGMIGALLVTGTTFNLVAFVGAILLVGYVVNNGIVLVDYVNTLRSKGLPLRDSLIKGGRTRLKPILMSIMTTLLGLLPLALGFGTGSELRAPMGRAVFGGLASSTVVTLILIPTMYWLIERRREARRGAK